jgi:signal transduction histidine kinase
MKNQLSKPTFFWQGLLILLPAVVLATFGFVSLRQDRVLAFHDATEQAKTMTKEVVEVLLPSALGARTLSSQAILNFQNDPSAPELEPILLHSRENAGHIAFLIGDHGELLYPKPLLPLPMEALDAGNVASPELNALEDIRQTAATNQNAGAAIRSYQQLLGASPSGVIAAMAGYELATLLRRQGALQEAWNLFETIAGTSGGAVGETGLPLRPLAELQLVEMESDLPKLESKRLPWLNSLCATVVLEPFVLSEFLLAKATELNRSTGPGLLKNVSEPRASNAMPNSMRGHSSAPVEGWKQVWKAHCLARLFHQKLFDAHHPASVEPSADEESAWFKTDDGESYLITLQRVAEANDYSLHAWPEQSFVQHIKEMIAAQSWPAYLGIDVEIAGRKLLSSREDAPVLASAASAFSTLLLPRLKVSVSLVDPASLYSRQRTRTIWFGLVIALSALAVFVGFAAAWRAFQRQARLSEMKSNFVSSVSHELRAPLASVRLMAEELEDIGPQDRLKNKEYHRFIVQECRRLSALIENVLDLSRHEQGRKQYEFEPTDLVALVQETAKGMAAYGLDKQIGLTTSIRGEPVEVEVDGRSIQQVLVNLIDNAVKHSPANSTVRVGLEFQSESAVLWVEDTGQGIPTEEHGRIFEQFYRRGSELRRETQGIGLGLAIVKYVVEAHHGKVSVQSEVGQGSRFIVMLPLHAKSEPPNLSHHD